MQKNKRIIITITSIVIVFILTFTNLFFVIKQDQTVEKLYQLVLAILMLTLPVMIIINYFVFKQKSLKTLAIMFASAALILGYLNLQNSQVLSNISIFRTVPDFTGQTINDVQSFIKSNQIEVTIIEDYSEAYEKGVIFDQTPKAPTLVSSVKQMTIYVSLGLNPDKLIVLPDDILDYDVEKFVQFVEDNKLSNVIVDFETSIDVKQNSMISLSAEGKIRRSGELRAIFSYGENIPTNAKLEDFSKMSLFRTIVWLKQNAIPFETVYDYSDTIPVGQYIKQNPAPGSDVNPESMVQLVFSKGVPIIVPNFLGMSIEQINEWGRVNIMNIVYKEVYDSAPAGTIISQSIPENEKIDQKTTITITTSKGPLVIPGFSNLSGLRNWADNNGVYISVVYESNDSLSSGALIRFNPSEGNHIRPGETITAVVSQGKSFAVPNFYGKSKASIENECSNLGLSCSFSYGGYNDAAADTAINQSVASGTSVNAGASVHITLSNGPAKSYVINVPSSLLMTGNADKTISGISAYFAENYPGVNFSFNTVPTNDMKSGLIAENSQINIGSTVYQGQSYTMTIYE